MVNIHGKRMTKEDWKCAKCPKYKAHKHEELYSFGSFGNNEHKKNDNNDYCEEHFKEMEEYYDNLK